MVCQTIVVRSVCASLRSSSLASILGLGRSYYHWVVLFHSHGRRTGRLSSPKWPRYASISSCSGFAKMCEFKAADCDRARGRECS